MLQIEIDNNFESWRTAARNLLEKNVEPSDVVWCANEQIGLFHREEKPRLDDGGMQIKVSPDFIRLADAVACYDDPQKWPLLYRLLFRIAKGEKNLLKIESDADVRAARVMEKGVRRDVHKFHAFVRFREISPQGEEIFAAWHEPQHWCVKRATPFFARRFGDMKWSIFTPKGCAHWDKRELTFSPPATRASAPSDDQMEDLWRLYYRSIFNPFRLKVKAMKREFPVKHWHTLPEAELIPELIRKGRELTGDG